MKQIKEWYANRERIKAMKLFMTLYADPKSTMQGILQEAAIKMAREMFMRMLDMEGFAHCKFCLIRAPLRKLAETKTMLCEIHYKQAMESYDKLNKSTQQKETPHAYDPRNETSQVAGS